MLELAPDSKLPGPRPAKLPPWDAEGRDDGTTALALAIEGRSTTFVQNVVKYSLGRKSTILLA